MKNFWLARPQPGEPSFALISVLALVSLAALSATAFLASARLDRLAGRPLADVARLEMALNSGQSLAISTLQLARGENYSRIVTYLRSNETNELGYLLVGAPDASNPSVIYYPLFSVAQMSNVLNPSTTNDLTTLTTNIAGQGDFRVGASNFIQTLTNGLAATNLTNLQLLGHTTANPRTSPPVAWITLTQKRRRFGTTNETSEPVVRIAYFVEDLQGLIDVERMGGMPNRDTGTNPMEISLSNATGTLFVANSNAINSTNRVKYLTPGMVLSANGLTNPADAAQLRYLATGLRSWGPYTYLSGGNLLTDSTNTNGYFSRIPYAVQVGPNNRCYSSFAANLTNYVTPVYATNPGNNTLLLHRRLNLNALLQSNSNNPAQAVNLLVSALTNQLPEFSNRAGGMTGPTYLSNIAANIVDYVDADTNLTLGAGYRGVEAVPFLNERLTRYEAQDPVRVGEGGWMTRIRTIEYFEFWNLHASTSPPVTLNISLVNTQAVVIAGLGNTNFNINQQIPLNIPAMPPGSYWVANSEVLNNDFTFDAVEPPDISENICNLLGNESTATYTVAIQGGMAGFYDQGRGSTYSDFPLRTDRRAYMSPSYPSLGSKWPIAGVGDATFFSSIGDPRASFYMTNDGQLTGVPIGPLNQIQPSYTNGNTSFGGRTFQSGMSTDRLNKEVSPRRKWPDSGHDGTVGTPADGRMDTLPSTGLFVVNEANFAPGRRNLNTNGILEKLTDLGAVFDPIQWAQTGQHPNPLWASEPGAWINLSSNATPNPRYGGGTTLRIGRPEFTRFAFTNYGGESVPNMGMSAVALLDFFTVTNAAEDFGGRININTASGPVLAALAAGCRLGSDPLLGPGGTNYLVFNSMATNAFVRGVQKFRHRYPFHTPTQLAFISPHPQWPTNWPQDAVFGNTNTIVAANSRLGVTSWNDAAAEEWFSKVYQLGTVDSWNYRCYVVAQLLNTNGTPRGAVTRKYYQIYTRPNPNQQNNFSTVVTYESSY